MNRSLNSKEIRRKLDGKISKTIEIIKGALR